MVRLVHCVIGAQWVQSSKAVGVTDTQLDLVSDVIANSWLRSTENRSCRLRYFGSITKIHNN